jgi:FkbM family methyltransferase
LAPAKTALYGYADISLNKKAMKKILESFLGESFVWRLQDFRAKWLPSQGQKIAMQQEAEEISLRKQFYSLFVKPGDLCFDVGANMGNRISPLLQSGAKVVAVEPQEKCARFLKYKFGNKIEIIKKGLGESEGIKNFYIASYDVLSSFSDEWINSVKDDRFKHASWNKTVQVPMTTLDNLIKTYGHPSFIKIDVEGYELEVLKGLHQPVKMISFEYTFPELINRAFDCIDEIEKSNATIECNYSTGESMEFALNQWLTPQQMKNHINAQQFTSKNFGDIYVRAKG